jgi:hypothetical protein
MSDWSLTTLKEKLIKIGAKVMPTTATERLTAIQDRIWAMHDALLTLRLPFESLYNSLTDEQRRRLRRDASDSAESGAFNRLQNARQRSRVAAFRVARSAVARRWGQSVPMHITRHRSECLGG